MKKGLLTALVVAAFLSLNTEVKAQLGIGAYGGYNTDAEEVLVGATVRLNLAAFTMGAIPLIIAPGFEIYPGMPEGVSLSQFDLNAMYALIIPMLPVQPYLGGGLAFLRSSVSVAGFDATSTSTGFNLLGGAQLNLGPASPFGHLRVTFVEGGSGVSLIAGILIGL